MRALTALALILTALTLGSVLTACTDETGAEYYETDVHHGYPGPGVTDPRDSQ